MKLAIEDYRDLLYMAEGYVTAEEEAQAMFEAAWARLNGRDN